MSITEPIGVTQAYCDFAEQIAAKRTARELKYADVPPPGGAIQIDEHWRYNEGQARRFQGTKRGTDVRVDIIGWQDCDGRSCGTSCSTGDILIDSTAVRENSPPICWPPPTRWTH
jgi:hypothetical protein